MSATIPHPSVARSGSTGPLRFGSESGLGIEWQLKRNCSCTPRQALHGYLALCAVSLLIAFFWWFQGATLVLPFAGLEVLAVGAGLFAYARHAADHERIRLEGHRLTVEHAAGNRIERAEFLPAWVRVEPEHGERSLIELSGQGQRISVGRFVRPELRRQLADEIRWALRRWQSAPGHNNSDD